jgi:DNA-binding MarR family transcriptional regulator
MAVDKIDRALRQSDLPHDGTTPREVMSRIFLLAAHLERKLAALFGKFGITQGEADVLNALRQSGNAPVMPKALTEALMCSGGAITNRLDRLEAAGLIVRSNHPSDRRAIQLTLTKAGRTLTERMIAERQRVDATFLPTLTREQRKALVSLLRTALLEFEDKVEKKPPKKDARKSARRRPIGR